MTPKNNYIICKDIPKEKITKSGIVIPDGTEADDSCLTQGEVISSAHKDYKKGDQIIFSRYIPEDLVVDDIKVYMVKAESVRAIV